MKGKTNSSNSNGPKGEVLNLSLTTNQVSHGDIAGAEMTLAYDDVKETLVWEGKVISVKIPAGCVYTVLFGDIEGYSTPGSVSFTAEPGNSRTVEVEYQTELLTVNVTSDEGSVSGYTVEVSDIGTQTTASATYKIPFGTAYTVSASDVSGYKTPAVQSFTASLAARTVGVTYVYDPATDLSMQDIYGNSISQTTANCYVVSKAGQYKFPLVFGNAIKDGATNSAAYTKKSGSYSMNFVDYNDAAITSPYIETMSGTVSSVGLSMADTDGVFTDMSIVSGAGCRYVQFNVVSVPDTGANGIISVKDSSGVIMWNWHIWVWPYDLTPVTITNKTGYNYNILPVHLATKLDSVDSISSTTGWKNWLYQWGRPTPTLCRKAYTSTTNSQSYGERTFTIQETPASSYGVGITNPEIFFCNTTIPCNWFGSTSYYNLWDANCTSTGNSDNDVVKTVYDPCPVGFKMPNGNTFTYFSKTNVIGSFSNGWYFKRNANDTTGVFFPATGLRTGTYGDLSQGSNYGYVHLSSSDSQQYAYKLRYYPTGVANQDFSDSRAYGYSVRPVAE